MNNIIYLKGKDLYAHNDKKIGEVFSKEDGFYDFWPDDALHGYWPAYMLRAIADLLDEMNEPYQKELDTFFIEDELVRD